MNTMKKITILIIWISFVLLTACRQPEKQLVFPQTLNNKKTSAHTEMQGTRMSMVLPYYLDNPMENAFAGGIGDDIMGIVFYENHSKNYYEMESNFRTEFETAYQSVVEETHLTINGFPAMVVYVHHDEKEDGYHLLFGDSTFVAYIMTVHPNNSQTIKKEMFESLASICYDREAEVNVE